MTKELKEMTPEQLRLRVMELEKEVEEQRSTKDFYYKRAEEMAKLLKGVKGITDGLVTLLDQTP